MKLERNIDSAPVRNPQLGPNAAAVIITIAAVGFTCGKNISTLLDATARAVIIARITISAVFIFLFSKYAKKMSATVTINREYKNGFELQMRF